MIEGRFVRLFREDLNVEVLALDRRQWQALELEPRFRFGYGPPTQSDPDASVVVPFSPELIDAVTASLSERDLDTYLLAIEAFVAGHLMLPDSSSDEVMAYLESEMAHVTPCLRLLSEVEMRAIDAGIVARL